VFSFKHILLLIDSVEFWFFSSGRFKNTIFLKIEFFQMQIPQVPQGRQVGPGLVGQGETRAPGGPGDLQGQHVGHAEPRLCALFVYEWNSAALLQLVPQHLCGRGAFLVHAGAQPELGRTWFVSRILSALLWVLQKGRAGQAVHFTVSGDEMFHICLSEK